MKSLIKKWLGIHDFVARIECADKAVLIFRYDPAMNPEEVLNLWDSLGAQFEPSVVTMIPHGVELHKVVEVKS